ncbi:MAG: Arc family DNA binding domain-containing protein [Xanthomonadales bacterium]|nr:Arc family DNA binding domain-containing protein [Gammaproteobacteria bacterium]MBT8050621.1 Arc family DNA binding domain-containing protein [Gammaproteobacteria bacterium]MBT8055755.1 Arc family DNA binding domain-containing protein [Gammaproteobacteria bacterium]NNJ79060.1 Arc family DNA binding domain-containing protein [Xanthomonadales bacterium]NNL05796.1 Arc family DNA binding domain-containing protein [Xanthomonadales bacterium]
MPRKKSFPLRIDEKTWEAVRRWSDDDLRSVNAQIEYLLREALRQTGRLPAPVDKDRDEQDQAAGRKALE